MWLPDRRFSNSLDRVREVLEEACLYFVVTNQYEGGARSSISGAATQFHEIRLVEDGSNMENRLAIILWLHFWSDYLWFLLFEVL